MIGVSFSRCYSISGEVGKGGGVNVLDLLVAVAVVVIVVVVVVVAAVV